MAILGWMCTYEIQPDVMYISNILHPILSWVIFYQIDQNYIGLGVHIIGSLLFHTSINFMFVQVLWSESKSKHPSFLPPIICK